MKIKAVVLRVTNVLDKTLKGVQIVCDSITERFFRAPGPRTKNFKLFFCRSINYIYIYVSQRKTLRNFRSVCLFSGILLWVS